MNDDEKIGIYLSEVPTYTCAPSQLRMYFFGFMMMRIERAPVDRLSVLAAWDAYASAWNSARATA